MISGGTTSWTQVRVGMYVQDKTGRSWRVDGTRPCRGATPPAIEVRLTNSAGQSADVIAGFDDLVIILIPTIDEAEALIAAHLPVRAVERRVIRMEELEAFPDTKYHRAHIASHLLEQHGISISVTAEAENDDIAGLLEVHALAHAEPWRIPVPHVHVPFAQL